MAQQTKETQRFRVKRAERLLLHLQSLWSTTALILRHQVYNNQTEGFSFSSSAAICIDASAEPHKLSPRNKLLLYIQTSAFQLGRSSSCSSFWSSEFYTSGHKSPCCSGKSWRWEQILNFKDQQLQQKVEVHPSSLVLIWSFVWVFFFLNTGPDGCAETDIQQVSMWRTSWLRGISRLVL